MPTPQSQRSPKQPQFYPQPARSGQARPQLQPPKKKSPLWLTLLVGFPVLCFHAVRASWRWYRRQTRRIQIIVASIIALALVIGGISSALGTNSQSAVSPSPTPTQAVAQAATSSSSQDQPTAAPTKQPTPAPTAKPTSKPANPTPTPVPNLSLTFTDVESGIVGVHTLPNAALTIKVLYCSGHYATSQSLQGVSYADSAGDYTWYWNVETSCHGTATAYVTASWNGKTVSTSAHFTT